MQDWDIVPGSVFPPTSFSCQLTTGESFNNSRSYYQLFCLPASSIDVLIASWLVGATAQKFNFIVCFFFFKDTPCASSLKSVAPGSRLRDWEFSYQKLSWGMLSEHTYEGVRTQEGKWWVELISGYQTVLSWWLWALELRF